MKISLKTYWWIIGLSFPLTAGAQTIPENISGTTDSVVREPVTATFKSDRMINGQSNETLHQRELNFCVDHRFGDIAGRNGGISQFFGLDHATDIKIGFKYGLTDRLTVGIARAKGATAVTQLYETSLKYRLLRQTTDNRIPVAVTFFGSATVSGVRAAEDKTLAHSFRSFAHRISYVSQLIIARKFSPGFSLLVSPVYVYRNYVVAYDDHGIAALGMGGRVKLSKRTAFVADYFLSFRSADNTDRFLLQQDTRFYHALGAGFEIETGGHVFHLNFTNATGIQEMQFVPETTSSWLKGQFRWGFSISRAFML